MRLIDADAKVLAQFYDEEHEEWEVRERTVADYLSYTDTAIPFVDVPDRKVGKWIDKAVSIKAYRPKRVLFVVNGLMVTICHTALTAEQGWRTMQKKYYDGFAVLRIICDNTEDGKLMLKLLQAFADEPSAEVIEPKKGKWIGGELGKCSVCGHEGCASDIWSGCGGMFCPNCGAKMKGDE